MTCAGSWRNFVTVPLDGPDMADVLKCSGCAGWMVIVGHRAVTVAAADASTVAGAIRLALPELLTGW